MPTYDYKCQTCDHQFEKFQAITADPIKECPECGEKVTKLVSAGLNVIFKGSGFYSTDYRDSSYDDAKKKESPAAACPAASNGDCPTTPCDAK